MSDRQLPSFVELEELLDPLAQSGTVFPSGGDWESRGRQRLDRHEGERETDSRAQIRFAQV